MPEPVLNARERVYEAFPGAFSLKKDFGIVAILDSEGGTIASGVDYHDAWHNASIVATRTMDLQEQEADHSNIPGAILCTCVVGAAIWLLCAIVCRAFHVSPWALLLAAGAVVLVASAAAVETKGHQPR